MSVVRRKWCIFILIGLVQSETDYPLKHLIKMETKQIAILMQLPTKTCQHKRNIGLLYPLTSMIHNVINEILNSHCKET